MIFEYIFMINKEICVENTLCFPWGIIDIINIASCNGLVSSGVKPLPV